MQARGLRLLLNDIKKAKWAIIILIAYFALFQVFFHTTCPLAAVTGFPCPGCGLTRAGLCVLRLDFAGAWRMNPFIYPIGVFALLWFIRRYAAMKEDMRGFVWYGAALLTAMVIYYIWRMYRYFPGEPPMNYYGYSLAGRIMRLLQTLGENGIL